ncbi:MAG: glycoside hydrolase [Chitinophagales bacterium]|nr:glycoside hydrolase [Chitinophagales bacterium]
MKKLSWLLLIIALISQYNLAKAQISWSMGMNVASNSYENMHPRVVADASGDPLVIWGRMSDESVFFSRWNGTAFTLPVKLNPSWLTVATASWMGSDIASKGDTVYVVMKQTPETESTSHIYIVTSFDGGITFSVPKQVEFIADSLSRFPTVTVDATGNPVVAFMKFDNMFADSRWAVTKSSDYGNTFSTDVKASGWSGADALVCDCCPGGIVGEGNNIAMLYRNNQNNIRDSWASISTDGGTSFTEGWNVDQNNWNLISCPATGPDGVIIGDSLYAVFMNGESGLS